MNLFDLNLSPPPVPRTVEVLNVDDHDDDDVVIIPSLTTFQQGSVITGSFETYQLVGGVSIPPQGGQQGVHVPQFLMNSFDLNLSPPPVPSNVEVLNVDDTNDDDDDVVIIPSPTTFQRASSSRRTPRRTSVINLELVEPSTPHQRRRPRSDNVEGSYSFTADLVVSPSSPPPPPPPSPLVICPICMEPAVNETTTKCGHIFCETCIKTAVSIQAKCPTCRHRVNYRTLYRIYISTNI